MLFLSFNFQAQTNKYWKSKESNTFKKASSESLESNDFKLFELDLAGFQNYANRAQSRSLQKNSSEVIISLPDSQGKLEDFRIFEMSSFEPELQSRFPEIKSFRGQSVSNPSTTASFSVSPYNGISAIIRSGVNGTTTIIDPVEKGNVSVYKVFDKSSKRANGQFTCSTIDEANQFSNVLTDKTAQLRSADDSKLRTFKLALSCTAEYSNYFGATSAADVAKVLAAFNATMTRVNGVFETDFNATMVIISESTNVIYYNAATDPYSDGATGSGGAWNTELQNTLSTSLTGTGTSLAANNAAYHIGHLFGASGGGGNAGCIGCVCRDDAASTTDKNKGSGFTSPGDDIPHGDNFDIDYVAHEMGHQFGGNHTFTHSTETGSIAQKEPGSGSTIMGYAGITGATDVQAHSDALFHAISIEQITTNIKTKTCPTVTDITNTTPTADAGSNFILPIGTAFKLTGNGSDADGDSLTYIWEQMDSGTSTTTYPSATKTSGPNFRSYTATTSPTRHFPRLEDYLANGVSGNKWEIVPTVARTLSFRFTVRDNKPGGSNNGYDEMTVSTVTTAGPFAVTSQAASGISYTTGSSIPVTWSVNNTTSLTGATNVNVKLSIDGGLTYPYTLASNIANNGTANVNLPAGVSAPFCRILVEPTANIFYAINTKDFAVGYNVINQCLSYTSSPNATIVESNPLAYQNFTLNIPANVVIKDVNVTTRINHQPNQLYLRIDHPDGTKIPLYQTPTGRGKVAGLCADRINALNATFDDAGTDFDCDTAELPAGGTFRPLNALSSLNGKNSAGNWTFKVADVSTEKNNNSGTLASFTVEICYQEIQSLSTSENEFEGFALYPNPNKGSFKINLNSDSNKVDVKVFDMSGRSILNKNYSNSGLFDQEIRLNNAQSGVYLVSISDGIKKIVKRIIIE